MFVSSGTFAPVPTTLKISSIFALAAFCSAATFSASALAFAVLPIPSQILFTTELISEVMGSASKASISAFAYSLSASVKAAIAAFNSPTRSYLHSSMDRFEVIEVRPPRVQVLNLHSSMDRFEANISAATTPFT